MNSSHDLVRELTDRLTEYYAHTNKPVTLVRAETDLLVRLTTVWFSSLGARVKALERKQDSRFGWSESLEMQLALTDMALISSVAKKLRESEQ